MTEEQFEHLSARATAYAARRPRAYLWRVACWAALGYAVVLGALVLCVGLPAGLWWACVWASEHGASLSGLGVLPLRAFVGWYAPRFNAVSFALARRQEFEADRWAAEIVGARTAAGALLRLVVAEATLDEEFWPALEVRTRREPEPPAAGTMLPSLLARLRLPLDPRFLRRRLARVLARETEGGDTHPAPAERLTALGFPAVLTPPGQPGASALPPPELESWFADPAPCYASALDRLLPMECQAAAEAALDAGWRCAVLPHWQASHQQAAEAASRLAELDGRSGTLTEDEAWERLTLRTLAEAGDEQPGPGEGERGRAAVTAFLGRHPAHRPARFTLGRLLLEADDPAGVVQLDAVSAEDEAAVAPAFLLIADFLRRQGRPEEAAARRWALRREFDRLDLDGRVRNTLTAGDRFVPHGLDGAVLAAVRAFLRGRDDVGRVYLVRKELVDASGRALPGGTPFYVVACRRRYRWWELPSRDRRWKTAFQLQEGLPLPPGGERLVIAVDGFHSRGRLVRRLRAVEGSLVFDASGGAGAAEAD